MKHAAGILAVGVGLAALVDLQVGLRGDFAQPTPEDMARFVTQVRKRLQPGDVVVHSPLLSVASVRAFADVPARPDRPTKAVMASRRVLLVDAADYPMFGLGTPEEVLTLSDDWVLKIYAPSGGATMTVYHLASQLSEKTLHIERPVGRLAARCDRPRAEGGYGCPGQPEWLYAAPRRLRIDGQDTECVWAHPTTGGAVVLTIPGIAAPPAGRRLTLEVSAGLTDDAARGTPGGAEVKTEVRQGGQTLGQVVVPNRVGWFKRSFSVQPKLPVALVVTTLRDGRRHHCVNARIIENEAGS